MVRTVVHFINGSSCEPGSERYIDRVSPVNGEVIAKVADGTSADVDEAARAAAATQRQWAARKPIERGRVLAEIARRIRSDIESLSSLEKEETGKPAWQAPLEIELAAQYFEFYAGLVNVHHGEVINLGSGYHSYTIREPFGVVGVILPWNAPLNQAARAIAPALATGNSVVAKPSEETPGSLVRLAALAVECGLPPGVFNVVVGTGQGVGMPIVKHELVRKVAFTGSVRAGREIGAVAAERVIPLTLELGGKSPNIVFEDADMESAVPGALRAFTLNAGQVCLAGTRLLVQRSIQVEFVSRLVEAAASIKVGPEPDALMGPLTTRAQFERVREHLRVAVEEGARIACGGDSNERAEKDGWFVAPTILTHLNRDMRVAREEVFGPVLGVFPFDDEEEAVRLANDTEYGLAAGIWTSDLSRAHRVAAQIEAGQIYVNEYQAGGVETPLGGYKMSGYGREKGIEALHHYTQLKCITIKL